MPSFPSGAELAFLVAIAVAAVVCAVVLVRVLRGPRAESPTRPERLPPELQQPPVRGEHPVAAGAGRGAAGGASSPRTLRDGLEKTRRGLFARLADALAGRALDEATLESLEQILFEADLGVKVTQQLLQAARGAKDRDGALAAMREQVRTLLAAHAPPVAELVDPARGKPFALMIVGVNGVGKTTTIGKLAARFMAGGKSVVLGAADTFRAAATEQLQVWGQRAGVHVVTDREGADPAAVAYATVEAGRSRGADVVIVDTAGRLHTKTNLMDELGKVKRVMGKAQAGAPHEVWLVLDATTGQNAVNQARIFNEAVGVTGLVLTKLDGTAKGGIVVGIVDELHIPVRFIGIGEGVEDLRPFDAAEFTEALLGD